MVESIAEHVTAGWSPTDVVVSVTSSATCRTVNWPSDLE